MLVYRILIQYEIQFSCSTWFNLPCLPTTASQAAQTIQPLWVSIAASRSVTDSITQRGDIAPWKKRGLLTCPQLAISCFASRTAGNKKMTNVFIIIRLKRTKTGKGTDTSAWKGSPAAAVEVLKYQEHRIIQVGRDEVDLSSQVFNIFKDQVSTTSLTTCSSVWSPLW